MDAELSENEIDPNDYYIIKPPLLRALHDSDPMYLGECLKPSIQINKAKNCYSFLIIMKIVNDRKHCPQLLEYYGMKFGSKWFWKKHLKLLFKDVLPADLTDIDIVEPDHGYSYAPPFTDTNLPTRDTPNTISAFLNH